MNRIAATLLVVALGCQRTGSQDRDRDKTPPPVSSVRTAAPDYAKDIESLCESVVRSGADKIEPAARSLTIANWLAANLKTPESRKFLVEIQPLIGEAKAKALESEAHRVGLAGCALAAEWHADVPPGAAPSPM